MSNDETRERALVQSLLDVADDRLNDTIRAMETDINRLRDSWATTYQETRRASDERVAATQRDLRAWLSARATADGEVPSDPRQAPRGASLAGAPVRPGAVPAGPPIDPREAELAEAARIRNLSMQDWAIERQSLIRADRGTF